jgi:hypothetical protein
MNGLEPEGRSAEGESRLILAIGLSANALNNRHNSAYQAGYILGIRYRPMYPSVRQAYNLKVGGFKSSPRNKINAGRSGGYARCPGLSLV